MEKRTLSLYIAILALVTGMNVGAQEDFQFTYTFGDFEFVFGGDSIVEDSIRTRVRAAKRFGGTKPEGLVVGFAQSFSQTIDLRGTRTTDGGLSFESDIDLEQTVADTVPSAIVAGEIGFLIIADDLVVSVPIEGSTGEFSRDVFLIEATTGLGNTFPGVSFASQFRGQVHPAEPDGDIDRVLTSYLRAGPRFNELTYRFYSLSPSAQYSDPRQVDQNQGQITSYGIGTLRTLFSFKAGKGLTQPGYVFTWDSFGSGGDDSSLRSIQARLIAADGTPLGNQFQVNTFSNDDQFTPQVATSPSGFVVVWTSRGSPGDDDSATSIQARRYDSEGAPLGDQFQVNQATMGDQFQPDVAMADNGSFMVTWTDTPLITSNVFARLYRSDGTPQGDQFQLNTEPGADSPSVNENGGDVIVAWRRGSVVESATSFINLFASGFESR